MQSSGLESGPNRRDPLDDVTGVAIRVIGGTNYPSANDSVSMNELPLPDAFPFLAAPWDGRSRFHQNPWSVSAMASESGEILTHF